MLLRHGCGHLKKNWKKSLPICGLKVAENNGSSGSGSDDDYSGDDGVGGRIFRAKSEKMRNKD